MPAKTKKLADIGGSRRWIELAKEFPLRPIRSDADAALAVAVIDRLTDREALTAEEEDYLEVLSDLVADYEDEHEPEGTPAEILRGLIENQGVSQADVARGTGLSDATISHILVGHRPPSRRAMAALAAYFKVDPGVFL